MADGSVTGSPRGGAGSADTAALGKGLLRN